MVNFTLADGPGQEITVDHLNRLEAVKIIIDKHNGLEPKEKIMLMLQEDQVQVLSYDELMMMSTKELKYNNYLLMVENQASQDWSDLIFYAIRRRILDRGFEYFGHYIPMYMNRSHQKDLPSVRIGMHSRSASGFVKPSEYDLVSVLWGKSGLADLHSLKLGLILGDMAQEIAARKIKNGTHLAKFTLVSRKEHYSGNTHYSTKAKFCESGISHDIAIRCNGDHEGLKGNQSIFIDGMMVDLFWDVHDWFFKPGSGSAVFMFKTRSGMDSRLWLEERLMHKDVEEKLEFSLLIYACDSR
ncbi:hypothetical protein AgCh_005437 [Apium graveolens]